MNYIIKIDNREKDIISILQNKGYNFELENLDLGDFQFLDFNSKEPIIIIERKTYSDLNASIKDGRYKEQKERLLYSVKKSVRKIILLEGSESDKICISKKILDGVIINTLMRDNIHIYETKNKEATVEFLENIMLQLPKYYEDIQKEIVQGEEKVFMNEFNCKTVKKENLTPQTCFRNMFNQIPGVSNSIAGVLCDKYKNMENFIFELKRTSNDRKIEIINLISNEKYGSNMRRVGEKTAEKIYIYVFNDTGEIVSLNELKKKNTVKKKKDLKKNIIN
jgi:crossover junction endonuclease MUS81